MGTLVKVPVCAKAGCNETFDKRTSRQKYCEIHTRSHSNGHTLRDSKRTNNIRNFISVDGEGIQGRCKRDGCSCARFKPVNPYDDDSPCMCGHSKYVSHPHVYVLLGVGDAQVEWPDGVTDITEIFSFLYEQFKKSPDAVFAGFYLGYDFNMWLRLLPRERAAMLFNASKRVRNRSGDNHTPFPVEYRGWQFDMMGNGLRIKLRPKMCSCEIQECKCPWQDSGSKDYVPFMYICDAGPFFQTSLLSAVDPAEWIHPIITQAEYDQLLTGKENRSHAELDDNMRAYNVLENKVLARLLARLNDGFTRTGVRLDKKQWFGPGQVAQRWMTVKTPAVKDITENVRKRLDWRWWDYKYPANPARFGELAGKMVKKTAYDAFVASYYGGWFEITVHGHLPGITYEYDLNSAYPYVISRLPCFCNEGRYVTGYGTPKTTLDHSWLTDRNTVVDNPVIRECHVRVWGSDPFMGPLPYRRPDGQIVRPHYVHGWYGQHEIDASIHAGLVDRIEYQEWIEHHPCTHPRPLAMISELYEERLAVGKHTPHGKSLKLTFNSAYGKFAQSVGDPVFGNPVYASLVTSGCRTLVLEAIATHPDRTRAVSMVATDGVYFLTPHPGIDAEIERQGGKDTRLGWWGKEEKVNLTQFKPGVYWDDKTRADIEAGISPRFKSRGVNARYFSASIREIDEKFGKWDENGTFVSERFDSNPVRNEWPTAQFQAGFMQTSVKQALAMTETSKNEAKYKALAGKVTSGKTLRQDSEPSVKRCPELYYDDKYGVWRSRPWDHLEWPESTPYDKRFGAEEDMWDESVTPDGPVSMGIREALKMR